MTDRTLFYLTNIACHFLLAWLCHANTPLTRKLNHFLTEHIKSFANRNS